VRPWSSRSRWAAGIVCALAAVGGMTLSACGSSGSSSMTSGANSNSAATSSSSGTGAGKHLTIGSVVFNPGDPYWISMKCGASAAAQTLGVSLDWQASPTPETGPEMQALNSVEVTNPNGVMVAPGPNAAAFVPPVKQLMSKGIPVVATDSALASNVALQTVETNQDKDGAILAPEIANTIGPHGTLAIISDKPGAAGAELRFQSLVALLHQKDPGIKILPIQYDQTDSSATAGQIAQSLILGNPGLSAIYAINGPMGIGVASGVQAAHAAGKVKVFAFDATPQEVTGVRNGSFTAIMGQSPYLEGQLAVQHLVSYLRSHPTSGDAITPQSPSNVYTPVMLIDKSNVNLPATKKFFYSASC
jgi:ribose transport system substrate-binding protein